MKPLHDVRVLLLGITPADADLLAVWLSSEGARVSRAAYGEPLEPLIDQSLNAVVLDMREDRTAALAAADALRFVEALRALPIIALISQEQSDRNVEEGFAKKLVAPLHPSTLSQALVELGIASPIAERESSDDALASLVELRARTSDLRSIVKLLNSTAPFRFTSVLRFEESGALVSIWTFDRENPELNNFPEDATVSSSYCMRVRDTQRPFAMADAAAEPSVAQHPARHTVLSYCGVPLLRQDGSFFGTLCSYDVVPRFFQERSVQRLVDASGVLRKHWPELA